MTNKLYVLGVGPGSKELITPLAMKHIEGSDVLIGGKRNLEIFQEMNKEKLEIGGNLEPIYDYIKDNVKSKKISVLVSGDTGIYSILEYLKKKFSASDEVELEVVPGISSLQYLCSKIKLNWNDIIITSIHGREQEDLIDIIQRNTKVAIFTGGKSRPERVCKMLLDNGLEDVKVYIGENLSYKDEKIVSSKPKELVEMSFDSLSIMIVENSKIVISKSTKEDEFSTQIAHTKVNHQSHHSIPDSEFIRGKVPMTKEEVRVISLSKLKLSDNSVVYDIGAGTGSVSIECALACKQGMVYAVEKETDAVELIKQNRTKFEVDNLNIIEGYAPEAVYGKTAPDRVFIGGSGGNMEDIFNWICSYPNEIRVVVNTVTVESTFESIKAFETKGFKNVEVVQAAISKGKPVGGKHLMQAMNPVYIISGDKEAV